MANPALFLEVFVFICVFMVFWSRVPAEPTVTTTLHTRKGNDSLLIFDCETETRPPRMLVQLIDGTVVTIVNEDKTLGYFLKEEIETPEVSLQGMHGVRVSQEVFWWNQDVDYKCLIDILIGNFSYQSNFSRRVSSFNDNDKPSEDVVRISPTYTIISEEYRMESSMTFHCYLNFQLTTAVRWSLVRDGHDNVELLDDNLENLNNTKMKISVESSMMESVLNIDIIDLPADKYIISCRSRSRDDKSVLSASATFEISDVDTLSKYRKLVPILAVASCFFFVVHLITTFLLCYTCKKRNVSPPTPPSPMTRVVSDVADHPHSVTHFNDSNTSDDYVNGLDAEEEQEDYVNQNQIKHHTGYPANKYRK